MGRRTGRPWERTLLCVIKALQGLHVLVELQNDVYIRGVLDDCDDAMKCFYEYDGGGSWSNPSAPMFRVQGFCDGCSYVERLCRCVYNVTIKDASMEDVEGNEKNLPLIFIRGSHVRFVHIPDSVNVCDAVEEMRLLQDKVALPSMSRKGPPSKPGESANTSGAEV